MSTTIVPGRSEGRVAVVTGAASGIGLAIIRRFVAEGGRAVGGDINDTGLAALQEELGERVIAQRCDVTKEADVESLVRAASNAFGRVDAVFNVAGASKGALLVDLSEEDWDFVTDLCLKGVFFGVKHGARAMIAEGHGGVIVNIASLNSRVPMVFGAAYSASKAGVASITQSAAIELAPHGIRAVTVSPGLTATPLTTTFTDTPFINAAFMERIPLQRAATPEDIAGTALFLASDDAAYVTGTNVFVDGGWEQTAYPDLRRLLNR